MDLEFVQRSVGFCWRRRLSTVANLHMHTVTRVRPRPRSSRSLASGWWRMSADGFSRQKMARGLARFVCSMILTHFSSSRLARRASSVKPSILSRLRWCPPERLLQVRHSGAKKTMSSSAQQASARSRTSDVSSARHAGSLSHVQVLTPRRRSSRERTPEPAKISEAASSRGGGGSGGAGRLRAGPATKRSVRWRLRTVPSSSCRLRAGPATKWSVRWRFRTVPSSSSESAGGGGASSSSSSGGSSQAGGATVRGATVRGAAGRGSTRGAAAAMAAASRS